MVATLVSLSLQGCAWLAAEPPQPVLIDCRDVRLSLSDEAGAVHEISCQRQDPARKTWGAKPFGCDATGCIAAATSYDFPSYLIDYAGTAEGTPWRMRVRFKPYGHASYVGPGDSRRVLAQWPSIKALAQPLREPRRLELGDRSFEIHRFELPDVGKCLGFVSRGGAWLSGDRHIIDGYACTAAEGAGEGFLLDRVAAIRVVSGKPLS